MDKNLFAFVAGSAHLDIIAEVTGRHDVVDKVGTVKYEFGGTAYNYAINLQYSGIQTTFMGALNGSPISQMIQSELRSNNIRTHIKTVTSMPEAGFVGQLIEGDLFSAVSSMPVEKVTFSKKYITQGLQHAQCVMLDCNFSVDALSAIINVANSHDIPVYIAGVSEIKSLRAIQADGKIDYLFLNKIEASFVIKNTRFNSLEDLSLQKNITIFVTNGGDGVSLYSPKECVVEFNVEKLKIDNGNTVGAGDLFAVSVIKEISFNNKSVSEAVVSAINTSIKSLQRKNANLGRLNVLEENIEGITSKAEKDNLTGLLNRDGIERFMKTKSLHEKPFFIILCDIDYFKSFNDTYGHDIGDKVLVEIAGVISSCLRKNDAVGRWGGEEFVCLIDDKDPNTAENIAERMRDRVSELNLSGIDKSVTISAGIAFSDTHQSWNSALKCADNALYHAKDGGRNRVVFS